MGFDVFIPARFGATRLPGKPLIPINGKPLIQWVYEVASQSAAERVVVATDDPRIQSAVNAFGGEACLTASEHRSGTDRIADAADQLGLAPERIVVNLQCDEPKMPAAVINQVAQAMDEQKVSMATACHAISNQDELMDPHVVKVVCDQQGRALYFSRAPIPWPRDHKSVVGANRHIGIYAYRVDFLKQFTSWAVSDLEEREKLEQLRALSHGVTIHVCQTEQPPGPGIDTQQDLESFRRSVE